MDRRQEKSQYGQGSIVEKLCYPDNTDHKGFFVDVGGWDGVAISNTFYLEKMKGWDGILVEPIVEKAQQAVHNRWCKIFTGCVSNVDGNCEFLHIMGYSEMLSGLVDGYNSKMLARVDNEIKHFNQKTEKIMVPCLTLNSLLEKYNVKQVDYLSLDTMSSELDVLKAYDPSKHPCKIISLDTNGVNDQEIKDWFSSNGYVQAWKCDNSDEYIYINHNMKFTWE